MNIRATGKLGSIAIEQGWRREGEPSKEQDRSELRLRHRPQQDPGATQSSAPGRAGVKGPLHKSTQDRLDRQEVLQVVIAG